MISLPPLKALRVFWAVARYGSFKRASEQLFVTQAAVSQQIKSLETHFGCSLFTRSVTNTHLTEDGKRLLPYVEQAFASLEDGVLQLMGDPKPDILRISAVHSFTSSWLIHHLSSFQSLYPNLMVQLMPSNRLVDFKDAELDVAVRMGMGNYEGVISQKIMTDKLALVACPLALKGKHIDDPKEVFSLPVIFDTSPGFPEMLQSCVASFGLTFQQLRFPIQSDNAVPLIEHALAGKGVLLTNRILVERYIQAGTLVELLGYCAPSRYSLYLVAPERHFSYAKVQQFVNWFSNAVLDTVESRSQIN
ncbi:LysR substrate-binding domain-containing protein [Aestuariibacter sp. AA17]|uniref:LysR substrate-binding domain-containing protein n=1 Tax=Fluctibacter corallii TaxID=2984329 RepID=A0ABT3A8T2_9ALTE|nr:LysR substrate-binding domain-containing protein [Aestuariibacter sp. AA17]MCV2885087.1 LysR substrate-binding domain-containing protein [Aestuariibacter sp. AA17]